MDEKRRVIKRYKRPRRSNLTVEDVAQIKAHLSEGRTLATLARYFNVHHKTIGLIRDGKIWVSIKPAKKAKPLSFSKVMGRI